MDNSAGCSGTVKAGAWQYFLKTAEPETVFLAVLCLVDMAETIYTVSHGLGHEANPFIAWSFNFGPVAFALVKLATVIPAIIALEVCRVKRPRFARVAGSAAVFAYLMVYLLGTLHVQGRF